MPSTSQWIAFLVASFLLIQVPGPSLLFTIGRALTVGRRDALVSVAGNALGLLGQVVLVAVGLGALVATSAAAYTVVKVVGALYVVWLGVQTIRHRRDARATMAQAEAARRRGRPAAVPSWAESLRVGAVVGLTNPKTIVFFVAFLPQFVDVGGPVWLQTVLLGLVFSLIAVVSDSVWALLAARAREWFARRPQRLDTLGTVGGGMLVTLGLVTLATD